MRSKLLQEQEVRTFAIVFDKGDEFINGLQEFAREQQLAGSHFTAIGAFSKVTLGYFDRDKLEYRRIPVEEQHEMFGFARLPAALAEPDWLYDRRCLVMGLGPVGLLAALALRLRGAEVFGLDVVDVPLWDQPGADCPDG